MNPTLLVLAAGMGSRYGGLKQLDEVGPNGETIMDYTIYDAIQAGFDHAVFVIRKEFEEAFEEKIVAKYKDEIQVDIVFQELQDFVPQHLNISEREKPWGTGHAVLVAKNKIHKPFAVFNADDFYGRDAIERIAAFLKEEVRPDLCALVGYPLKKTLSENGTVNRGLCEIDSEGYLKNIEEKERIERQDGKIVYGPNGDTLDEDDKVSMNLWGLHPSFFTVLEHRFKQFIIQKYNKDRSEFFLPFVIDERLKEGNIRVQVLETESDWFGVTYREDLEEVKEGIQELVEAEEYPSPLWKNL